MKSYIKKYSKTIEEVMQAAEKAINDHGDYEELKTSEWEKYGKKRIYLTATWSTLAGNTREERLGYYDVNSNEYVVDANNEHDVF